MTSPLRIVYVVSRWNQETETFVRREVAAALDDGVTVQVISLQKPGAPDGIVDDSRLRIVVPSMSSAIRGLLLAMFTSPVDTASSFARILRYGRPGTWTPHLQAWAAALGVCPHIEDFDVVLAHFAWLSSTTADVLGRLRHRPYAIFVHAHAIYEKRCQDRYLTDRLRRACRVFVESELIAEDVRKWHGAEPVVMRMGVPAAFITERSHSVGGHCVPLVVSVGALREKKGHDLLIRAVAELPHVRLNIAGEGPERGRLERLVRELGVGDRVALLGHLQMTDVRELLDTSTVFCLASRQTESGDRDGVPNVLIEAMARGLPVLSTDVSGIPDLVRPGCGVVVRSDDVNAIRTALSLMLDEPDATVRLGLAAKELVRRDYTVESNWARLGGALRSCAGGADGHVGDE